MSGSKSKSKTQETSQTSGTTTSTPTAPSWIQQPWQDYAGQVSGLMAGGQSVAPGASALQNQAFGAAAGLTGGASKGYSDGREVNGGAGNGYTSPSANGFDLAQSLGMGVAGAGANLAGPAQGYDAAGASARTFNAADLDPILNKYLGDVVGTTMADYDQNAGVDRARMSSVAANNGGARNSNNAIRDAVYAGESGRGRAATEANLKFNAYDKAAGILGQDSDRLASVGMFNAGQQNQAGQFNAGAQNQQSMFNAGQQDNALSRALQAAGLLSGNASARGQDTRANIGLQADLGAQQRDIATQTSEGGNLARIMALLQGIPLDAFVGRSGTANGTTSGTSTTSGSRIEGGLDDISKLMMMFSYERLKRDIETEGYDDKGRRWVSWRYVWDQAKRHVGVIAQEVLKTDPNAVIVHPSGYLMVNYGALDA